ncbi:hypothetical protein GOODEAATRI_025098, partial [Goodea atripinnis]
ALQNAIKTSSICRVYAILFLLRVSSERLSPIFKTIQAATVALDSVIHTFSSLDVPAREQFSLSLLSG